MDLALQNNCFFFLKYGAMDRFDIITFFQSNTIIHGIYIQQSRQDHPLAHRQSSIIVWYIYYAFLS